MTRDLDTPLEIALGVVESARAQCMMTWTRLTTHSIVSDFDLGKVNVYTQSKGCEGLHVVWIIYRC